MQIARQERGRGGGKSDVLECILGGTTLSATNMPVEGGLKRVAW